MKPQLIKETAVAIWNYITAQTLLIWSSRAPELLFLLKSFRFINSGKSKATFWEYLIYQLCYNSVFSSFQALGIFFNRPRYMANFSIIWNHHYNLSLVLHVYYMLWVRLLGDAGVQHIKKSKETQLFSWNKRDLGFNIFVVKYSTDCVHLFKTQSVLWAVLFPVHWQL